MMKNIYIWKHWRNPAWVNDWTQDYVEAIIEV